MNGTNPLYIHCTVTFHLLLCCHNMYVSIYIRRFTPKQQVISVDFSSIDNAMYDVKPSADISLLEEN